MLLNGLSPADDVHIEHEDDRDEYVMNESGRIWQGSTKRTEAMAWNFGQFEDVCLEAALYLLDKAGLQQGARSNPALVVRAISAMVSKQCKQSVQAIKANSQECNSSVFIPVYKVKIRNLP